MGLILCKNSLQKWAQEVMITRELKSAGDGSKEVRAGGGGGEVEKEEGGNAN